VSILIAILLFLNARGPARYELAQELEIAVSDDFFTGTMLDIRLLFVYAPACMDRFCLFLSAV
jgi:hypothetical protein